LNFAVLFVSYKYVLRKTDPKLDKNYF